MGEQDFNGEPGDSNNRPESLTAPREGEPPSGEQYVGPINCPCGHSQDSHEQCRGCPPDDGYAAAPQGGEPPREWSDNWWTIFRLAGGAENAITTQEVDALEAWLDERVAAARRGEDDLSEPSRGHWPCKKCGYDPDRPDFVERDDLAEFCCDHGVAMPPRTPPEDWTDEELTRVAEEVAELLHDDIKRRPTKLTVNRVNMVIILELVEAIKHRVASAIRSDTGEGT